MDVVACTDRYSDIRRIEIGFSSSPLKGSVSLRGKEEKYWWVASQKEGWLR